MDFWCQFLTPLFATALLSGKLHFVLEHIGIAVEYFYTIFGEQKTEFGTILNFKTCHQHQPSIRIHTCKTGEKCKNPTMPASPLIPEFPPKMVLFYTKKGT